LHPRPKLPYLESSTRSQGLNRLMDIPIHATIVEVRYGGPERKRGHAMHSDHTYSDYEYHRTSEPKLTTLKRCGFMNGILTFTFMPGTNSLWSRVNCCGSSGSIPETCAPPNSGQNTIVILMTL
jgi:hypothetical protein